MHTFRARWPVLTGLMLFALTPATLVAAPQIIEESARLVSPDPELPLNGPVALEENTIVVGSIADLGDEMFNLAVYVFEREAGTSTWAPTKQLAEFTGRNPWTNQLSVAVSGSTVAIGRMTPHTCTSVPRADGISPPL